MDGSDVFLIKLKKYQFCQNLGILMFYEFPVISIKERL